MLPTACSSTASLPAVRPRSRLRLGLPRGYFWENLDAELAAILEAALARLREAGVVLVEGDVANVAALDAAAGFPIMLYETVIELISGRA